MIDLSSVKGTILLQSRLPAIASDLTILGDGNDTISGNARYRVLAVDSGTVTLENLTIADGLAKGADGVNGAGGSAGMGGGLFINAEARYVHSQPSDRGEWHGPKATNPTQHQTGQCQFRG
jgi:hypothetical protein